MGNIILKNVFFGYEESEQRYVLENINLNIHTTWKLGVLGKNGSGKTTLLHVILNNAVDKGNIHTDCKCNYFPITVDDNFFGTVRYFFEQLLPFVEEWRIHVELAKMDLALSILDQDYYTLSEGEKCKVQLIVLFLDDNKFPLIDEPTNNLDLVGRKVVANYLREKSGFIVVSHDEHFLNDVITHVVYIENKQVYLTHGNVDTFKTEREKRVQFLNSTQTKLKREINQLTTAGRRISHWATKKENETIDSFSRKIAAKQMKRAKAVEKRVERKIKEKEQLLIPLENDRTLKINTASMDRRLTYLNICDYALELKNHNGYLFKPITLQLQTSDVVWVKGKNGIGKTTFLSSLLQRNNNQMNDGIYKIDNVSYIPQQIQSLQELHNEFLNLNSQQKEMFYFNLNLIGFRQSAVDFSWTKDWSMGELKKIAIALRLVYQADVFIWDEISNFLDIETIDKLIDAVHIYRPTVIFVDHNEYFATSIATKAVELK